MTYASLCLLSYERPQFLLEAVQTAVTNAGAPFELIVHDDGSRNPEVQRIISGLVECGMVSQAIFQPPGRNQGVGEAVRKSFAVASGDLLIKADQDLIFQPDWLVKLRAALDEEPGFDGLDRYPVLAGGFRYYHEPVDFPKTLLAEGEHGDEVTHFCGSLFGIYRSWYERFGMETHSAAFAEDWDLMTRVDDNRNVAGTCNVITRDEIVINRGFGLGPSTVVEPTGKVHEINRSPLLFG